MTSAPWPRELRYVRAEKRLEIDFDSGETFSLPAEYLRVESPSAEVKGHAATEARTVPGKRHAAIERIELVGNYAVRLCFDDGHTTGIYPWSYLHRLGREYDSLWASYLARLDAHGLSRDRA